MGLCPKLGDFAENFTTEGIDLTSLQPGMRINIGDDVILEISPISKDAIVTAPFSSRLASVSCQRRMYSPRLFAVVWLRRATLYKRCKANYV